MFENSSASTISNISHIKCMLDSDKPAASGDIWNVYVSKMDSFKYFYVQKTDHYEYIKTISSALKSMCNNLITPEKFPKIGNLVAVHNDESDFWYRAKVKRKNELGLFVCFIDFGGAEILVKNFKSLPMELAAIKPIARRCLFDNLWKIDEEVCTTDIFYLMNNYIANNEMTVTFSNNAEPYSVTLSHNGKDVVDIILGLVWEGIVPDVYDDPIDIAKRKMLNEMVTCTRMVVPVIEPIVSIKHFYVETEFSNKIGKKIRIEIESKKSWIPVLHPDEGKIVIVRSARDEKLYRARVILYYEGGVDYKCFLIDCGTFETCSEFFEPSEYLRTAPPVKIHCSLNESKNIVSNLLESVTIGFVDEMIECDESLKIMDLIEVGNPCTVDFEVEGLKMSRIIMPREVRVINVTHINSFEVLLNVNGMCKIEEVLKNKRNFCAVSDPEIFEIYVTKVGQQYKRVKYLGRYNLSFEAMLVDEKSVLVVTDELYELPKSIKNIKTMDLCCSLSLNTQLYNNKKFIDICNNGKTTFVMVVIKNDYVRGHVVKLFLNSIDVTTMIAN